MDLNPFELFLELKTQIEADREVMDNLRLIAFGARIRLCLERRITLLGEGRHHKHYRAGKVGNVCLATRTPNRTATGEIDGLGLQIQKEQCEYYIESIVTKFKEGRRVPIIAGGVHAQHQGRECYFLIVEDLTAGGTACFTPAQGGGLTSGRINGEEVLYDLEDSFLKEITDFKYMKPGLMIQLQKKQVKGGYGHRRSRKTGTYQTIRPYT